MLICEGNWVIFQEKKCNRQKHRPETEKSILEDFPTGHEAWNASVKVGRAGEGQAGRWSSNIRCLPIVTSFSHRT
jgi:hypothetical protein